MNWIVALLNFVHLFSTVTWIGGMVFMMLVFMPVLGRRKDLGLGGAKLMVDAGKRFMALIWISVALFLATGIPMTLFNPRFPGSIDLTSTWSTAILVKHIVYVVMLIGGVVQTFTIRGMDRILGAAPTSPPAEKPGPPQPPPELAKLKRRQIVVGLTVFILGILTLLLTAIAEAAAITV